MDELDKHYVAQTWAAEAVELEKQAAERFKPYTYADLMAREFPENEWLVRGLIPKPGTTILSGAGATFKTWMLLDIAIAIASGGKALGQFECTQTGVLIVDEENYEGQLKKRLLALGQQDDLPIHFMTSQGAKLTAEDVALIRGYCLVHKIKAVIIDSFVGVSTAREENDANGTRAVFDTLKPLHHERISVIIAHHHNKAASSANLQNAMRGSSDIRNAVDSHIAVERGEENDLKLSQTKCRVAPEMPPFSVRVITEDDRVYFEADNSGHPQSKQEKARDAILAALSTLSVAPTQKELARVINQHGMDIKDRTFRNALDDMLDAGEIIRTQGYRNSQLYQLPDGNPPLPGGSMAKQLDI